MKYRIWMLLMILAVLVGACRPAAAAPQAGTLTVYAAASLTEAFTEIGAAFEDAHPGLSVQFNFGGSQNLRTQIEQGAQADVFASANAKEMDALVAAGLIQAEAPQVFLTNLLVVILPDANPAGIDSLDDLGAPGVKLVLAAEEVPAGKYAREMLAKLNALHGAAYGETVLANVVSNEDNVKQVVTKVQLGEADAGIVYVSDASAAPDLQTLSIPDEANVSAAYPIAPLAEAVNPDLAMEFIGYILSLDGQSTLSKWGFMPPAQ